MTDSDTTNLTAAEPISAGDAPIPVEVEQGKTYFWCSCGKSLKQPYCDGSHAGTDFTPMAWTAPDTRRVFMCACKKTAGQPLCDGSHNKSTD